MRPAVNLNLSVSRVGSAAQKKLLKSISGSLKLFLASYKELLTFSAFSSDLEISTQRTINRGGKLTELLKQKNFSPMSAEEQFVLLFAGLNGLLDDIETKDIANLEKFILEEFSKFDFFDENETIEVIHKQVTESLLEVIEG